MGGDNTHLSIVHDGDMDNGRRVLGDDKVSKGGHDSPMWRQHGELKGQHFAVTGTQCVCLPRRFVA